jgi:P4 family phage/plasmid primase-like protien
MKDANYKPLPRQQNRRRARAEAKRAPVEAAQKRVEKTLSELPVTNRRKRTPSTTLQPWAKKSRITDDVLDEALVCRVTNAQARNDYGLRAPAHWDLTGTLFIYFNRDTGEVSYCRLRRDNYNEDAGESKYHGNTSEDSERVLYCHPSSVEALLKENTTIVLVESEKAVLAGVAWARRMGCEDKFVFLAMGGAYGWKSKKYGTLPDLAVCYGRRVVIMLDANVSTNKNVGAARLELTAELHSKRSTVFHANLPNLEGVNGSDDLLAQPDGDKLLADVLAGAEAANIAPFSEHALAERLAGENSDKLRFVSGVGWHFWDGQRWKPDNEGRTEILVQELCRTAARECPKPSEQNKLRSRRTREAIQREAQAHLPLSVDELDKNPMLLNTQGGTVDLRTGQLAPPNPNNYCTKIAGATPNAKKPQRWRKFLSEITRGDKELERYMQRFAGYCLTGTVSEQVLQFLYGTGANGKSVFTETMQNILGDYAKTTPAETLMVAHHPQHATSTAALRGARLVAVSEVEDGNRWAESKLKELTGGTRVTARFMRQDEITFLPQFKLIISGNHRPKLRNTDNSMRRRLHMVPFTAYFPEDKRDTKLMQKLQSELGGILQWAIDGCLAWQREGLNPPSAVLAATEDYFATQDTLGTWLEEKTREDKQAKTHSSDLYNGFKRWCEARGEYAPTQRDFSQKLEERGFAKQKSHGLVTFRGLRLPTETEAIKGASARLKLVGS